MTVTVEITCTLFALQIYLSKIKLAVKKLNLHSDLIIEYHMIQKRLKSQRASIYFQTEQANENGYLKNFLGCVMTQTPVEALIAATTSLTQYLLL